MDQYCLRVHMEQTRAATISGDLQEALTWP